MEIANPVVFRFVEDYDFILNSGIVMPFTIDASLSDTLVEGQDRFDIFLAPKPRLDAEGTSPAERVIIFKSQILAVQNRTRELVELTPEQQFEWKKFLQSQGDNVQ